MKRIVAITGLVILLAAQSDLSRAQWVQTNGPFGAEVSCIAAANDYLFAAMKYSDSDHSGIYYSNDQGLHWLYSNSGLPKNDFVSAIAASGSNVCAAFWSGGIFYSFDRGKSWNPPASRVQTESVSNLFVLGAHIFAVSDKGLLRSDDSGRHWNLLNDSLSVRSFAARGDTLYVGTTSGIFCSTDFGNTWNEKNTGASGSFFEINSLVLDGSIFYATSPAGILRSTDNGENWTPDNSPSASYIQQIVMVGGVLYAVLPTSGIYRKTLPTGWEQANDGLLDKNVIAIVASGPNLFAGTQNTGVHRLDSGALNWEEANSGLPANASVYAISTMGNRILTGQAGMMSFSDDSGNHWQECCIRGVSEIARMGNNIFAASQDSGVCRSSDTGTTWIATNNGLSGVEGYNLAGNGLTLLVETQNGVFASTDTGASWTLTNCPASLLGAHYHDFFAGEFASGLMYLSTTDGAAWPQTTPPDWIPLGGDVIFPMAFASSDSAVYVAKDCDDSGGQIFRTYDNGSTWTQAMRTPSHVNILYSNSGILFAGMYGSIAVSMNEGVSWSEVGKGLPYQGVLSVAISDSNVYVGVDRNGVWRRPLSEIISLSSVTAAPPIANEIQSYPNPFSSQATITFTNQNEGYAEVTIVNLLGCQVARLFTGELATGEHSFVWDMPPSLPNGMYECVVNMGGQTHRISLVHLQ